MMALETCVSITESKIHKKTIIRVALTLISTPACDLISDAKSNNG